MMALEVVKLPFNLTDGLRSWGGTWSLELAWMGCTVANEDTLAPEDLAPVPTVKGTRWNGKTWIYPFELRMFPIVYNKEIFAKAGPDPHHPPTTWSDFMARFMPILRRSTCVVWK